jgi:hypothetical protein
LRRSEIATTKKNRDRLRFVTQRRIKAGGARLIAFPEQIKQKETGIVASYLSVWSLAPESSLSR